jgi:heavy metal sensor kinase
MRRLPIRLRLTLAFALAMALVLAAIGSLVYLRFRSDLDATIDQGLAARSRDLAAVARQAADGGQRVLSQQEEGFAQILSSSGRVLAATPAVRGAALLDRVQLAEASTGEIRFDRPPVGRIDEPSRIRASPLRAGEGPDPVVVVVGATLDDRNDSLDSLRGLLLVGGPVALLLASLAGYWVAASALRPVEAMRRRAAEISATEPGRRLPVPPSRDEVARLGETLNEMLARLEGAFERERTFVSDASHELRTPLAILKAELELARRSARSPEELEAAIRSAAEETDRLSQLADDLLVVARAEEGRLPVHRTEISVEELLASVRERFAERCAVEERALRLAPGDGLMLRADRLRIEQALANMTENALRHGGGAICLAAFRAGGSVELHVTDEGPGFPPELIGTAFERFRRGDPARARGGSGLGLAIVEAVAEAHGGSAHAANREGSGADVWISLPDDATMG